MQLVVLSIFVVVAIGTPALAQLSGKCTRNSCYPATGDLLIGRESQLRASSTCGLKRSEVYCILAYLEQYNKSNPDIPLRKKKSCFQCDSTKPYFPSYSPNSHRVENIISKIPRDSKRWWQSSNGVHNVSIQLDLEAEFHFTHLIMTFKTYRPAAMYIERSFDFGNTWRPYVYYSSNCKADFPHVSRKPAKDLGDVVCTNKFTEMYPSERGEVVFRAVSSNLKKISDPYSEQVQELVKLTNLRIVFTRLHTLGDLEFDTRPDVMYNYYYAIYELNVRGSCSCYGHAQQCLPENPSEVIENKVYGKCDCGHNTMGLNCHLCKPFYNDLPWRPATVDSMNECKKCNCNNHATRCHFDAAVYKVSGGKSGGVCDDCMHNTHGQNCQECREFYYIDDSVPVTSPYMCKPCNCDPSGSVLRGECEQKTDKVANTVAGRCICKKNAGGTNCGVCKHGYWNMSMENPDGCVGCKCFLPGTLRNEGCNKRTGECVCKRSVIGELCDRCAVGHYGLAASLEEGCKPCNCHPVGSLSSKCEPQSGNCRCKEGMEGRRCDKIKAGYFKPKIDVYIYEAETKITGGTGDIIKLPGNVTGHTGPGAVALGAGDFVEITVRPNPLPGLYEVVIRVQPKEFGNRGWPQMKIEVIRPRAPDPNSFCGKKGFTSRVETYFANVNATTGAVFLPNPICFGPNETIIIRVTPNPYTQPNPKARILVDSIVLIPGDVRKILKPTTNGTTDWRKDWEYCRAFILALHDKGQLPQRCRQFKAIISVFIFGNTSKCQCDPTGSISGICDRKGGQCPCKPGVGQRKCNRCKDNHYGFGPSGCKPCYCDPRGSTEPQCDSTTGQCDCKGDAYGRKCDQCKPGFWNYPNCRQCECNFHTDKCDSLTGKCQNCTDFTDGDRCERCRVGYYGAPTVGMNIKCKPCLCPGIFGSGIDRSNGCVLHPTTNRAKCLCLKGYAGERCERCATNYYGNPLDSRSQCRPCDCNDNIDRNVPNSCDSTTGTCLKCLHNTMGSNCQDCRDGYYGNAAKRECKKCICNELGTKEGGRCDRKTGQCPCLPNVIGRRCDRCLVNHYNIASKKGCAKCDCDLTGSEGPTCNELSGQCVCKSGRGGLRCNECSAEFWGDPLSKEGCKPCNCKQEGSKTTQCNRRTGRCRCKPGITGEKCHKCDDGTREEYPNCVPCGECWIRWNRIITELLNKTEDFRKNAGKLPGGVTLPKNYADDLDTIEKQLKIIEDLLKNNNITSADVMDQQKKLDLIRKILESLNQTQLKKSKELISNNTKEASKVTALQKSLEDKLKTLKKLVDDLKKEASDIKDSNFGGAFATVEENKRKYDATKKKLEDLDKNSDKVKQDLDKTKADLNTQKNQLAPKLRDMKDRTRQLTEDIRKLKQETIPSLNKKICGGPWKIPYTKDPVCNPSCGGGGCDKCGKATICEGSSLYDMKTAEEYLNKTEKLLYDKKQVVMELQTKIQKLKEAARDTEKKATEALTEAYKLSNMSQGQEKAVNSLVQKMEDYINSNRTRREDLLKLIKEITDIKSPITDDDVNKLKKRIEDSVNKLKDIKKILRETKQDRDLAKKLKEDADKAKSSAEELLEKANAISKDMQDAKAAQKEASDDVAKLKKIINQMDGMLGLIAALNNQTDKTNAETDAALKKAQDRITQLEDALRNTRTRIDKIKKENDDNEKGIADIDKKIENPLKPNIKKAMDEMANKEQLANVLSDRGKNLKKRIKTVLEDLKDKLKRLNEAEEKKNAAERLLETVDKDVTVLTDQLMDIYKQSRERIYRHELC